MAFDFDEVVERENTSSLKYDMRKQIFNKKDLLPMWVADMDFKTPPFVIEAIRHRLRHEILGYNLIPPSFWQSAVDWIHRRHGWKTEKSWFSFSPGVVPALNLLVLTFTSPGDRIIIQPPVYFPFFTAVTRHGRELVANPLKLMGDKYTMDLDDLASRVDERTKMLILCSPHNPTGNVWEEDVLRQMAEICIRKGIVIVSDEIHADLAYKAFRHVPTASLSEETALQTITCMAPSKTFNMAGLSTAYVIIPDRVRKKKYDEQLERIHLGTGNIFGLVAMEAAYRIGDEWLDQLRDYLEGNLDLLTKAVETATPQITLIRPQATFLAWLDCRSLETGTGKLNAILADEGVGLSEGSLFGEQGTGFQRLNFGCPRSILSEGLARLQRAVDKLGTV